MDLSRRQFIQTAAIGAAAERKVALVEFFRDHQDA